MKSLIAACALLAAACSSVPRDAGLSDLQQELSQRLPQSIIYEGEMSADTAVSLAMMHNPRLQATFAELGIARADLIEASTISNPLFEAELRFPGDPYRPYELRLAQSLIELIQLPRRRAAGRAEFDAAKLRITSEIVHFAAEVRARYYDLIAATQHAAMSRTIYESAQTAAELAQRQHDAQNITDLDLEHEQARFEQAKVDLSRAEQQLVLARESLLRAIGRGDAASEVRLPTAFPEFRGGAEAEQQQLEQLALSRRLDLEIARREAGIAKQRVPLARLAALGDIEADFHYEREPEGARTFGPGIIVPIPIFNSGRAARTRAEAHYLRTQHTLAALLAESSSQIRSARATVVEAGARVEYYRDVILPRRKRIVELTKLEHNAMVTGTYQLLQAVESEAEAKRDFIEAQHDYWIARNDLDRAVNGVPQGGH